MSLALARKYRPRRFADVAVQSHVATTLRNAIGSDRLGHAYLFCGPRGTGKTTLARVLAMALNCEQKRPDHEPCGECPSCQRIWSGGASLDVVEMDAASNRGVDDARELRERAMYAPTGDDRHKIYILDEAHMLTREAWNTLLKVLEEPPPRVIFVFATTDPQKIQQAAAPVLSRVQRFDLRRIGPAEVRERLRTVLTAEGQLEAAKRNADRSRVTGTQCSTSLPKIVSPNASPGRCFVKSCNARIAPSARFPSPNAAVMLPDTSRQNWMLVTSRSSFGTSDRCGLASNSNAATSTIGGKLDVPFTSRPSHRRRGLPA